MGGKTDSEARQTKKVSFVADVHLIQILGEQLIGSEKVGILELIKNAYDSGATECSIWIEKVPGLPQAEFSDPKIAELEGPVITIADNGSGMDENAIENGWLRPATRIKTSIKEQLRRERQEADKRGTRSEYDQLVKSLKKEHEGRLPLGEKGVGRFATHRLGRHLILQTKTKQEQYEWLLQINWDDFIAIDDEPRDLHTVPLTLISREPQRDYGPTNSGTMLRIYGGRVGFEWTPEIIKAIGHSIAQLRSPAKRKEPKNFAAYFYCPQLSDEKFDVLTNTVPAPFHCVAIVDKKGKADIEIRFTPPESLLKPIREKIWTESIDLRGADLKYWQTSTGKPPLREPECGPFTVDIKVWQRNKEWIEYADMGEFTEYLDEFGGIGIYRDGLSILPAQIASKDDWLRLSHRRIKKVENLSYYQMWGSVDLVQENTLGLVDNTSRERMLETRPFIDLRALVLPIVYDLESKVKETRDRYKALKQGKRIPEAVLNKRAQAASQILKAISSRYEFKDDPLGLANIIGKSDTLGKDIAEIANTFDELRLEIRELQDQSDALLEAAGYGISIAVAVHEIEKLTSNLYFGLQRLSKKATGLNHETHKQIDDLSEMAHSLLNELKRIAPLRVTRVEPKRRFKVRDAILAAAGAFRLSWDDLNIKYYPPTKSDDFEMFGSYGACSQVFANLFDNATYWLKAVDSDNRRIMVQMNPDSRKVIVADTGPGIADKMQEHLFELFYSLKSPPSGLGLYICLYYMRQMKGNIRESLESERLTGFTGAHFTIMFPKDKGEE